MTKDEALKLALEALEKSDGFLYYWHESASDDEADAYAAARQLNERAITAIKEALAEDALQRLSDIHQEMEQQPVAYIGMINKDHFADVCRKANGNSNTPLYTSPPQRTWVGLTQEEIDYQAKKNEHGVYFALGALWAEAKLKEKNHD